MRCLPEQFRGNLVLCNPEDEGSFMRSYMHVISASACTLLVATGAALAGPSATPGPIAAVGVPALLVIGGAFVAVRYLRSRRK